MQTFAFFTKLFHALANIIYINIDLCRLYLALFTGYTFLTAYDTAIIDGLFWHWVLVAKTQLLFKISKNSFKICKNSLF